MINSVEVNVTYDRSKQVPRIGQSKNMRVNGRVQRLTLNQLKIVRHHIWSDDGTKMIHLFDATETWGGFYEDDGP